jgi:hypothetical protein
MALIRSLPLAVLLLAFSACQQKDATVGSGSASAAASDSGAMSESERTRLMQEKAAEIERRFAEIQEQRSSGQITDQEAMDAITQLDNERRELIALGEGGTR